MTDQGIPSLQQLLQMLSSMDSARERLQQAAQQQQVGSGMESFQHTEELAAALQAAQDLALPHQELQPFADQLQQLKQHLTTNLTGLKVGSEVHKASGGASFQQDPKNTLRWGPVSAQGILSLRKHRSSALC